MGNDADYEEELYDDLSIQLQVQQFFDEWSFRMLHSGLANDMDRYDSINKCLEMFVMAGLPLTEEDKYKLAHMEDEDAMYARIVKMMSVPLRKTFGHFALQLQLVVSAATRIRHALDSGNGEEIAKVMEDGDAGIGQQVLKQVVIEACSAVHKLVSDRESWQANMEARIARLGKCAAECESSKQALEALAPVVDSFNQSHLGKVKNMLFLMNHTDDNTLKMSTFRSWRGICLANTQEAKIRKMFQEQIDAMDGQLMDYKTAKHAQVRAAMIRQAEGHDSDLLQEILQAWFRIHVFEKEEATLVEAKQLMDERMNSVMESQKENCRRFMVKMTSSNDQILVSLVFQSWVGYLQECEEEKEIDERIEKAKESLRRFQDKKAEDSRKILDRMIQGTDSGLVFQNFTLWRDYVLAEKERIAVERSIHNLTDKHLHLKSLQKHAKASVASLCNEIEDSLLGYKVFKAWCEDAKLHGVARHYHNKLQSRKQQLEAVQSMFTSFASQLEQGIEGSKTPRNGRHGSSHALGN